MLLCLPARAPAQSRNVLVLDPGAAGRPFTTELTSALSRAFEGQGADRPAVYFEWLDRDRFPEDAQLETLRAYLATKYVDRRPQVVVALGDPSVAFAIETRDRLWPAAGLVAATNSAAATARVQQARRAVALAVPIDLRGTIAAALAVLPDTEAIALVAAGDAYLPQIEAQLSAEFPALRVIRLVDVPLAELRRRVAALPPRTIVLYSQYALDPGGRAYVAREVLTDLSRHTSRPLVGFVSTYLGFGIMAGSFRDMQDNAADIVGLVSRLLRGDTVDRIDVRSTPPTWHYDARELERRGVDVGRVPAGSRVVYRTPTLWSQYRGTVITGVAIMAGQTLLIATLVYAVRRRREAETQARLLSGRLLTAQEDERRRIARDLHDGANQEIALFALQLDRSGQQALAERARTLATELHRLSHELHPAILDQLGLVQAVQQFADQMRQGRDLAVEVRASAWPASLPPAVAIAFYRVAQEALHNAARHSGAREAFVELKGTPTECSMSIVDHGAGLGAPVSPTARLGLAGMRERLRGIGGTLSVESTKGQGTRVTARISRRVLTALAATGPVTDASPDLSKLTGAERAEDG